MFFFIQVDERSFFLNKKVQPCRVITLLLFGVYEYGGFIILFPTVTLMYCPTYFCYSYH